MAHLTKLLTIMSISIHALREEGDFEAEILFVQDFCISIHALREEGDGRAAPADDAMFISIHALREEGDKLDSSGKAAPVAFLSTPSARRATVTVSGKRIAPENFYPRPPRGGRPDWLVGGRDARRISIHALREEGDFMILSPFS